MRKLLLALLLLCPLPSWAGWSYVGYGQNYSYSNVNVGAGATYAATAGNLLIFVGSSGPNCNLVMVDGSGASSSWTSIGIVTGGTGPRVAAWWGIATGVSSYLSVHGGTGGSCTSGNAGFAVDIVEYHKTGGAISSDSSFCSNSGTPQTASYNVVCSAGTTGDLGVAFQAQGVATTSSSGWVVRETDVNYYVSTLDNLSAASGSNTLTITGPTGSNQQTATGLMFFTSAGGAARRKVPIVVN
jgi:hypothetical protein